MPIKYDPLRPFSVLFKWRGTVLPLVAKRKDTIFFMFFHCCLIIFRRINCPIPGELKKKAEIDEYLRTCGFLGLDLTMLTSGTMLLLFFAVFYNQQCFIRYQKMYDWCCAINGGCLSYVALLKCFVEPSRQSNLHNCIRMLLASVFVHYHSMTGSDLSEEEWQNIRDKELLFDDEMEIIRAYKGKKMVLLQKWCLQVTKTLLHEEMMSIHMEQAIAAGYPDGQKAVAKSPLLGGKSPKIKKKMTKKQMAVARKESLMSDDGLGYDAGNENGALTTSPPAQALAALNHDLKVLTQVVSNNNNNCLRGATAVEFASLERIVLGIKAVASAIVNELKNPLPFPYWHVLNLMMSLNYLLLAYALMMVNTVFTIPVFLLFIIIVSGLREVGTQLADPFGTDEVDFDVEEFLNKTYSSVNAALEHNYAPDAHRYAPTVAATALEVSKDAERSNAEEPKAPDMEEVETPGDAPEEDVPYTDTDINTMGTGEDVE